ncbi:hypothetical protein KQX54_005164 [Cotesia glomerata]|uniref:Uncharacterized protein n=1 Tax=Cotesia glomerata TaxID=32391 RepID=A0AAV7I132_COTGL|nr:hypothetical protein KQX54_005164 [Cotesia glomerata]
MSPLQREQSKSTQCLTEWESIPSPHPPEQNLRLCGSQCTRVALYTGLTGYLSLYSVNRKPCALNPTPQPTGSFHLPPPPPRSLQQCTYAKWVAQAGEHPLTTAPLKYHHHHHQSTRTRDHPCIYQPIRLNASYYPVHRTLNIEHREQARQGLGSVGFEDHQPHTQPHSH